jgi:hypothetical protein
VIGFLKKKVDGNHHCEVYIDLYLRRVEDSRAEIGEDNGHMLWLLTMISLLSSITSIL